MILVGDIGGTKCLLAQRDDAGKLGDSTRLPSGSHATFDSVLHEYLGETRPRPRAACFAVAGAVSPDGKRARVTNLPWAIEADELARGFGFEHVVLINDFHAQALAVLELPETALAPLREGSATPGAAKAILGAGTGLGQAFLVSAQGRYEVVPSEGGHTDFAPATERQVELWRWLGAKFGHVSYERVLSGAGIASCYQFLVSREPARELASTRERMKVDDPAAVVTRSLAEDPLCAEALDLFCEIYGQEASNLALAVLALGGVYLCGGIAPRILATLRAGAFSRGFLAKGRHRELLAGVPVWVVTNTESGLLGASVAAGRMA